MTHFERIKEEAAQSVALFVVVLLAMLVITTILIFVPTNEAPRPCECFCARVGVK